MTAELVKLAVSAAAEKVRTSDEPDVTREEEAHDIVQLFFELSEYEAYFEAHELARLYGRAHSFEYLARQGFVDVECDDGYEIAVARVQAAIDDVCGECEAELVRDL